MSQQYTTRALAQTEGGRTTERSGWLRQIMGARGDRDFAPTRADGFADTEQGFPDTEPLPLAELPHHRGTLAANECA